MSAGQFLKLDFQRSSDNGTQSLRGPPQFEVPDFFQTATKNFDASQPKRLKQKSVLLRTIGGRGIVEPSSSPNHGDYSVSKKTFIRRLSRKRKDSNSSMSSSLQSLSSAVGDIDQVPPSLSPIPATVSSLPQAVLCPCITVTPEVESAESGECFFWVAIEVAGVLFGADGNVATRADPSAIDVESYGCLRGMQVDLLPGPAAKVCAVFGDLHTTKVIHVHQTQLILAKIRLAPIVRHKKESSADLIADLESQLGDSSVNFMKVRLTYHHSAFSHHKTCLVTETSAAIRRHNPQSAWSPRISRTIQSDVNPVTRLVETYLPADDASEALRILSRQDKDSEDQGSPLYHGYLTAYSTWEHTESPISHSDSDITTPIDPARQIWSEMRRSSRSSRRQVLPLPEEANATGLHRPKSTAGDLSPTQTRVDSDDVHLQRNHIMQLALKNKRSVGQDTLRSIAPSVQSRGKGVGSTGLGFGFAWPFGWGRW